MPVCDFFLTILLIYQCYAQQGTPRVDNTVPHKYRYKYPNPPNPDWKGIVWECTSRADPKTRLDRVLPVAPNYTACPGETWNLRRP